MNRNSKKDMIEPMILNQKAFYFMLLFVTLFGINSKTKAQNTNIKNDNFWNTINGQPIYSQGGGIFKFPDPNTGQQKYYWYGVHYKEAETYRDHPSVTQLNCTFESVSCYSSTDLVNWTAERDVLTKATFSKLGKKKSWVSRLGVAYIKEMSSPEIAIHKFKSL